MPPQAPVVLLQPQLLAETPVSRIRNRIPKHSQLLNVFNESSEEKIEIITKTISIEHNTPIGKLPGSSQTIPAANEHPKHALSCLFNKCANERTQTK